MNSSLLALLSQIFSPIISYLKQQGAWDSLVAFWAAASNFFGAVYSWLSVHVDMAIVWQWAITFFKFVFAVLITLFKVLTDIFTWLTQYLK